MHPNFAPCCNVAVWFFVSDIGIISAITRDNSMSILIPIMETISLNHRCSITPRPLQRRIFAGLFALFMTPILSFDLFMFHKIPKPPPYYFFNSDPEEHDDFYILIVFLFSLGQTKYIRNITDSVHLINANILAQNPSGSAKHSVVL